VKVMVMMVAAKVLLKSRRKLIRGRKIRLLKMHKVQTNSKLIRSQIKISKIRLKVRAPLIK
jgi:hypothetical protein